MRRTHNAEFKARVAIEAIKELKTISELAQQYQLSPNLISSWKREFLSKAEKVFDNETPQADHIKKLEREKQDLVQQIGQLTVDNNWLKKKLLWYR